jgi:NAD(P)-dependent dehydrogenase (short-subunit alcohol dehydrogenase family)
MSRLSRQVVIVTGCSSGIGRALAAELARTGHRVFATARGVDSVAALAAAGFDALPLDVTDEASIAKAVSTVIERTGRVDMLVNNAGINAIAPLAEMPLDRFRSIFSTNVTGVVAMVQAVFPHMARERRGRIVQIGSIVGVQPTPYAAAYCASKAAVHTLSEVLRLEIAPFGIDLIVIQPGAIRSNIAKTAAAGVEAYAQAGSRYRDVAADIERRARLSQNDPTSAEEFARQAVAAMMRPRAPRLVRIGKGSVALPALRRALPEAAMDRLMVRQFGLRKLSR